MRRHLTPVALALGATLWVSAASATQRAFVYTQESRVLGAGESELEPWTTFRAGRERYFSRVDSRLEFEHGLTQALQLALYWNFTSQSRDVVSALGNIERVSESEFAGASLELKYQLTDPVADALGSALYLESTLGPHETELEGKLILDRALGKWLLAANLTAEYELEPIRNDEGTEVETALVLEPALAVAYGVARGFSLGIELRAPLGVTGEHKSSALFGGPVVGWADARFWGSLGVQPQLVALSGASAGSHLDLEQHERVQVRLLLGLLL